MAVVKMKKLRLIGLSSEKEKIIGALLRSGAAQLKPTQELELTVKTPEKEQQDEAASAFAKASVALDFLKSQEGEYDKLVKAGSATPLALEKKPLFEVKNDVSADDFEKIVLEKQSLLNVCEELSDIAARKNEIVTQINSIKTLSLNLGSYLAFDQPFSSVKDTKHVSFLLGTCKAGKKVERELMESVKDLAAEVKLIPNTDHLIKNISVAIKVGATGKQLPAPDPKSKVLNYIVFAAVEKEQKQSLEIALAPFGYSPCPYNFDCTAYEKIEELTAKTSALNKEQDELTKKAASYLQHRKNLQLLCDNYRFRLDILKADEDFAKTAKTFILEAFIPEPAEESVKKILAKTTENIDITVEEVAPEDQPPTLLKNNKVVAPYESITSVYSPPSYYEADPNPAVAIFYFIFFGIMLGDAGYGLLLAVACFLAAKLLKMDKDMKSLILVFGMGGISAIAWGILFGGVFSIESVPAVMFAPMKDPISMLALCFALGLVQIFVGMGYQAYNLIKEGKLMDAVYDIFSWYVIFIGAGLAVLSVMEVWGMPVTIGLGVLALGVVVLMAGGAIRASGVVGRVIGAVSPLYGVVGYFSDVMSYSRLFGLCLASGVIGQVFNTLAGLVFTLPVFGWLIGGFIALLGHTLNFAIGLLGIYVHDSRLQYIEFFGRFYHGGGKQFTPLGSNLKYVSINNNQEV